ncbi:hypothetical protein HJTV-2_gp40 [Haloarcula virus HJTV-2]|uniref:Uncharacterized protein n=1 Tax=Haloarcula virus HJTV-2 TaxID=2877986 RepID=A0AAE8XVS4_9CAUD|nr:hypothetical protein M1M33_gp107 [Haloarcula virus HJTV-2]UBF21660.1 hypothetical protein HJTV-2_gp40 [Haloarcula virus HJTV-2]
MNRRIEGVSPHHYTKIPHRAEARWGDCLFKPKNYIRRYT